MSQQKIMPELNDDVWSIVKEYLIDYDLPKLKDFDKLTKPVLQGFLCHHGIANKVFNIFKLNKAELRLLVLSQWKANVIKSKFINKYIFGFKYIQKIKRGYTLDICGHDYEYLFKHNQNFLFHNDYIGNIEYHPTELIKKLKFIE